MQHIPIIYSDEYTVSLEIIFKGNKAVAFIHADIRTWNRRVYLELQEKWKEFRELYTNTILALPHKENTAKFAALFGFKRCGKLMRHDIWVE